VAFVFAYPCIKPAWPPATQRRVSLLSHYENVSTHGRPEEGQKQYGTMRKVVAGVAGVALFCLIAGSPSGQNHTTLYE